MVSVATGIYDIIPPPPPCPRLSPSLISLMVSVDAKHHVSVLTAQNHSGGDSAVLRIATLVSLFPHRLGFGAPPETEQSSETTQR